jgi:hypothetical protein
MTDASDIAFIVLLVVLLALWYFVAGVFPIRRHSQDSSAYSKAEIIGILVAGLLCLVLGVSLLVISVVDGLALGALAGAAVFFALGGLCMKRWWDASHSQERQPSRGART